VAEVSNQLAVCQSLLRDASTFVKSCGPNYVVRANATARKVPQDARYSEQYGHTRIDSERAWDITTGTSGDEVVIGVVDTGVDYTHPDLQANMWRNTEEIAGNGIDDDRNGYVDDVYGWNSSIPWFAGRGNGDPADRVHGHGTHCAGIIGARGDNNQGVVGVNWNTKIMALKFMQDSGWGFFDDAVESLEYARRMKQRGVNVRVLNNSWGSSYYVSWLEDAVQDLEQEGIIFVAAAGNSAENNDYRPFFPASYALTNVVSVAASDDQDRPSFFSSYGGSTVHIAAPGNEILSTLPGGSYKAWSGTSMAAPFVAGALGLLLGYQPELTYKQAIERLLATGKPLLALEGITISGRLLNVGNLIEDIKPSALFDPELCVYEAREIPYVAPSNLTTELRVLPSFDQYYYPLNYTLELPFEFPFYSARYTSVVVGLNGIISFKNPLTPWQVVGYPYPPQFSIALLHSRFFDWALPQTVGVWVQSTPDEVRVQWRVASVTNPTLGMLTITASLFPDGTIRQYTSVPNDNLARVINDYSLLGIRGNSIANSLTVTNNGFPVLIRGEQGFEYQRPAACVPNSQPTPAPTPNYKPTRTPTPVPTATPTPTPQPSQDSIRGLTLRSRAGRGVVAAGPNVLTVRSKNNRSVEASVKITLDNRGCDLPVGLSIQGNQSVRFTLPSLRGFSKLTLRTGVVTATASIQGKKGARTLSPLEACNKVRASLQAARTMR
jgi:subtilisin family serine protease